jgi:transposase
MKEAAALVSFDRVLADAGYDAEHNHVLCRKRLGIRSTVIPARKRNTRKWPKAKYRRQMKKCFHKRVYGQRWQVESAISRNKRLLGSALRNRTWLHQKLECFCRVLTHNLMILTCVA